MENSGVDGKGVEGDESTCWEPDVRLVAPVGMWPVAARFSGVALAAVDCGTASSSFAMDSCVASA